MLKGRYARGPPSRRITVARGVVFGMHACPLYAPSSCHTAVVFVCSLVVHVLEGSRGGRGGGGLFFGGDAAFGCHGLGLGLCSLRSADLLLRCCSVASASLLLCCLCCSDPLLLCRLCCAAALLLCCPCFSVALLLYCSVALLCCPATLLALPLFLLCSPTLLLPLLLCCSAGFPGVLFVFHAVSRLLLLVPFRLQLPGARHDGAVLAALDALLLEQIRGKPSSGPNGEPSERDGGGQCPEATCSLACFSCNFLALSRSSGVFVRMLSRACRGC